MRNEYEINGDVVTIHLYGGHTTDIDLQDLEKANSIEGSWSYMPNSAGRPYIVYRIKEGGYIRLHRLMIDAPEGVVVDHIDGNSLNNRKSNLRLATCRENSMNRQKANKNNTTTGVRGVTLFQGRYRARVGQKQIGSFATLEEAAKAVAEARGEVK